MAKILFALALGEKQMAYCNKNLAPGQLVVLSSPEDIAKRRMYQLGRIHKVILQIKNGKFIYRRAKEDQSTGKSKIIYVFQDLSCIVPIENCESVKCLNQNNCNSTLVYKNLKLKYFCV